MKVSGVTSRDTSVTLPHFPAVPQSVGILAPREIRRKGDKTAHFWEKIPRYMVT